MSEEAEIDSEKIFEIKLTTDKNNMYKVIFTLNNLIEITANQINDIIHKSFLNKYSLEEIKNNKHFLQFNTLNEIFDEIKDRIYNNQIVMKENENNIFIYIPLPENQELIIELRPFIKNNNERLNELTELIINLKAEINNIKNENNILRNEEIANLKNEMTQLNYKYNDIKKIEIQLKNENKQLSKDIDDMKDKETQLIKRNYELNNDINNLKFEIRQLKRLKEDNKDKDDKLVNEKTQIMNDTNDVIDEEDQSINQKAQIIKDNNLFKKDVNLLT